MHVVELLAQRRNFLPNDFPILMMIIVSVIWLAINCYSIDAIRHESVDPSVYLVVIGPTDHKVDSHLYKEQGRRVLHVWCGVGSGDRCG